MIQVTVNGKDRELDGPKSLLEFLKESNISPQLIAIAHNGIVLLKSEYDNISVKEGDFLEIVRMVGGG